MNGASLNLHDAPFRQQVTFDPKESVAVRFQLRRLTFPVRSRTPRSAMAILLGGFHPVRKTQPDGQPDRASMTEITQGPVDVRRPSIGVQ